ncbi:hypothetical protein AAFC00_003523 [Neodothiora populina]|uniref:LisH domain-containing protein n=1 Tax=Neodothiora populina TaxID=2781224 RepID=A0ABR3PEG1_9PEZI
MSQPMNMSGMGALGGGAGAGAGMGGPNAPGGQAMSMNSAGTPGNAPTEKDIRTKFHTFIYDYFVKTNRFELARGIMNTMEIESDSPQKPSPNRKEVNGINDADSKEDIKRPDDLPAARVPSPTDSPFIYDWFCQFWDLYEAQRGKGSPSSRTFLMGSQQRIMNERRMRADPQMQGAMGGMRNGMMPNGMAMPPDLARKMMMQGRAHPAQMQQLQQNALRQQMMQQTQMQREGSNMDLNGQQRTQSPSAGENAPSPKRPRLEGSFNGAPIGQMGRGQAQGMPGQSQVEYAQAVRQSMTNTMNSNMNKGMPGSAPVMTQGSPAMDPANVNVEFINGTQIRPGAATGPQAGGANSNSNHALQDYQMQLMLLEQQNKKRLLMARQEQDNMTNGPGGPGTFPPAISPSGSRAGLSPNSADQMKRGTPKMSQGVVPSPTPDGAMGQARNSPGPAFDPSQMNPNMPQNMFPQMNKMPIVGPNGQIIQAPGSHPAMPGPMTPQQMEMFARANGGRLPNGFMPQGPPPMMPGQQPGGPMPQQQQQPPNMTPHQRNAAMPPPPAPTGDNGKGTQPSSPQQQPAAPPTPSQGKNNAAKGKKDKSNKAPAKKGTTGATPASEAEQPPTPTPAPPITPTSTQAFPPKNGQPGLPQAQQPQSQNNLPQNQPDLSVAGGPFGNLDGNDFSTMSLDFGNLEGPDVLDNFDFDSFLNQEASDGNFGFDANMGFDTGLEAGGVD